MSKWTLADRSVYYQPMAPPAARERILDTEASYFRGATAVGVAVGALLALFAMWILIRRHRLRERERDVKADRKALEQERTREQDREKDAAT